jgi:hypothetical protein
MLADATVGGIRKAVAMKWQWPPNRSKAHLISKVYPELVIRDEKGRIDGVRDDELAPMLLNEVQQQAVWDRVQTA